MSAKLPLVVAVALLVASPAASAWNILKNPDFSGGTAPWNLSGTGGGSTSYETSSGSPAGGSLRMQAFDFNETTHADQCVDVHKWLAMNFGLRKFKDAESGSGTHTFKLDIYDAADCGGSILGTITLPEAGTTLADSWVEVSVDGTPLPSGAISAKVNLDTVAGATGVSYYLIDHVQVVPSDEIFPNDFEPN